MNVMEKADDMTASWLAAGDPSYTPPATLKTASDEVIRNAFADAHAPTLRGLIYFLTADPELEDMEVVQGVGFLTSKAAHLKRPEDVGKIIDKAAALLAAYRDGRKRPPDPRQAPRDHMLRSIALMVGMPVPPKEYEYWREEFGFEPWARALEWDDKPAHKVHDFKVIVIGAGMGGINAAIQLKRAGFSFEIFERNAGVGGTWYENNYPGARVDLASRIYSHLFGVNYPWEHMFATSQENAGYANWCVDHFGIRDDIQFNTKVLGMDWDQDAGEWSVRIQRQDGSEEIHKANAVISAGGLFDRPTFGNFKGTDSFRGIKMHTARYDKSVDLSNARVAVIGTGASGLQMIPDLAPTVKSLTVFQRSAAWVLPFEGYRDELPAGIKWLDRNMPFHVNFSRVATHWLAGDHDQYWAFTIDPEWKDEHTLNEDMYVLRQRCLAYIEQKLSDKPDLMAKVTPDYPPLSKRFVLDNGWYDALRRDNVTLITDPIDHIVEDGIVTENGDRHEFDAIIFATGYEPNAFLQPMVIHGSDGVTPQQVWAKDGARAYWGVTVPHLPNFFMIYGPGTNGKISGPVPWGEMQTRYAMLCFKELIERGAKSLEIRQDIFESFNEALDKELQGSIWLDPRQKSYYVNEYGRSATNSPWRVSEQWAAWRHPDFSHYLIR